MTDGGPFHRGTLNPPLGRVARYLEEHLLAGPMHMTLIDPATSSGSTGVRIAERAASLGTHAIMVGGSTDVTQQNLDELVLAIKDRTHLPVIYFPSSAGAISRHVDAIYFLSTLNSRSPRYLIGEQAHGAPFVKALGIEALGLGYIIVEPGMKAGAVSEAQLVARDASGAAHARDLALAAQYFGMRLVYLEAGSGAPAPVPETHVRAVRAAINVPLIVGGGIRSGSDASKALDAGADVLVTGTIAETGLFDRLGDVVTEVLKRRTG